MAEKSIIIIGAGMGGLASGIYGRMNGYRTRIFEMHSKPGGQCASWQRKGYTFDACIHHLFGCHASSEIYKLWNDLGAMPAELVAIPECVSVLSEDRRIFRDYYDLSKLEEHLQGLSPGDRKATAEYIRGIRAFAGRDRWGELIMGDGDFFSMLLATLPVFRLLKPTMAEFGGRFKDGFLRKAMPLLVYSDPTAPLMIHLIRHAYGYKGSLQWRVGGAREFASSIERRYRDLGGEIHYRSRVEKILVENDRAIGIRLADGTEDRSDIVISNADGRKTIIEMLENRYSDRRIASYCADPPDETNWAVHVFLGVNRDLSREPSSMVMLLDEPVVIANHTHGSLEMQMYGFDRTMAPAGKGVIKVELVSGYSYWKNLHADRQRYVEEKEKVADKVIDILEWRYFTGLRSQIEVIDVPTAVTWERYMGGTHGFANMPNKKISFLRTIFGNRQEMTLPGLSNFYMAGVWVTSAGALFMNALSGRKVIEAICRGDNKKCIGTRENPMAS
ncbi:MAG TPA: NAD(P)/FAD-dependent oxidoreductase [Thermodesulfovibrionales bacterium]|nr:NAD(P)/FAD-dependent oxidoreductase [Thermodesulfovibrionales bacterium]